MRSLTRAEAAVRARDLQVQGYRLDLDLTRGPEVFGSETSVRFRCARPGTDSFVQLRPVRLHAAVLNGRPLDVDGLDQGRLALPGLAADNELLVRATMRYTNTGQGLHRFVDPADGGVYCYALCFLDAAPDIFACFDQPDLKAPVTLAVTAPPQWSVVGNGTGRPVRPGRWEFAATPPLATYFTTLIAGPYHGVHREHDGIPLSLYARRGLADALDREADEIFAVTAACLDWYHERFGLRYPFGGYRQAFVPEFPLGAMENPGCVTFRDELVFRGAVTPAEREERAVIIAHEMAHMWFGDLVTMRWWDDLWLNESFAEYCGTRVAGEVTRWRDTWTTFALRRKAGAYAADRRGSAHPVAPAEVPDTAAALPNFDAISYAKGASVLRQLAAWLGDEVFWTGLRSHVAAHAYGNAALPDLLAALGGAAGRDLGEWARVWLREPGANELSVRVAAGVVEVDQAGPVPRPQRLYAGWYDPAGTRTARVPVDLSAVGVACGRFPVPAGTGPDDLLVLNDGDVGYATVRRDGVDGLARLLPRIADPLTRALLCGAAVAAVHAARVPAWPVLELVAAAVPVEPHQGIVAALLREGGELADRYAPAPRYTDAYALLYAAFAAGLRTAAVERALGYARGVVRFALDRPGPVARLRGWLDRPDRAAGLAADPDFRWEVLLRLAVLGLVDAADIDREYARDRGAAAAEYAARCRAAHPDDGAKQRAWHTMVADRAASNRLVLATAEGFWQPGQQATLTGYVRRYGEDLPAMVAGRPDPVAAALARAAFPTVVIGQSTVDMAVAVLARYELPPAVRRVVADEADDVRAVLAARRVPYPDQDPYPDQEESRAR